MADAPSERETSLLSGAAEGRAAAHRLEITGVVQPPDSFEPPLLVAVFSGLIPLHYCSIVFVHLSCHGFGISRRARPSQEFIQHVGQHVTNVGVLRAELLQSRFKPAEH